MSPTRSPELSRRDERREVKAPSPRSLPAIAVARIGVAVLALGFVATRPATAAGDESATAGDVTPRVTETTPTTRPSGNSGAEPSTVGAGHEHARWQMPRPLPTDQQWQEVEQFMREHSPER